MDLHSAVDVDYMNISRRSSEFGSRPTRRSNTHVHDITSPQKSNKRVLRTNARKHLLGDNGFTDKLEFEVENSVSDDVTKIPLEATMHRKKAIDLTGTSDKIASTSSKNSHSKSSNNISLPMSVRLSQLDFIVSQRSSEKESSSSTKPTGKRKTSSVNGGLTSPVQTSKGSNKETLDRNARKRSHGGTNILDRFKNNATSRVESTKTVKSTNISTTQTEQIDSATDTMTPTDALSRSKMTSQSTTSSITCVPPSLHSGERYKLSSRRASQVESSPSTRSSNTRRTSSVNGVTSSVNGFKGSGKYNLMGKRNKTPNRNASLTRELETTRENTELEKVTDVSVVNADSSDSRVDKFVSDETMSGSNTASKSTPTSTSDLPLQLSQPDMIASENQKQKESVPSTRAGSIRRKISFNGLKSPVNMWRKASRAILNRNASKRSLVSINAANEFETTLKNYSLPEELEIFVDRCNNIGKTVIQNMKKVQQNHSAVTAEIKKFRQQVNDVLDMWEKEALDRVNDIMKSDANHLNSVLDECSKLEDEVIQAGNDLTEYKTKLLDVSFIETEAKNTFREYKFVSNDNISNLLKHESQIGEVKIIHEVAGLYNNLKKFDRFVPSYFDAINVKAENDTFDCDITGMTMVSSHKLVVADANNKSIKSIDTDLRQITSFLNFTSGPWDLTKINKGRVAVTIPNEKLIQYVFISPNLIMGQYMKVNGECHGIAYRQECLIVTFRSPGKVQIISLNGNVLKTINQFVYKTIRYVFQWPDYVTVSKDENSIYVSDWHRNTVTRLSWKGEVTGVYTDKGTKMAGVAVASDGSVFVCKRTSHSIVKLNSDCTVCETILEEKHGLKYPWSLCFCEEESKLYVDNNRSSNTVAVFELN